MAGLLTEPLKSKLVALLEKHEGREPCMYPDSKGNVTVGVGHLLPTVMSAVVLPFYVTLPDTPPRKAGIQQISAAYAYVKSMRKPFFHQLALEDEDIDALLLSDLATFEPVMAKTFGGRDLPECVQVALWDMVFNLGSFEKFPELTAAVQVGDWDRAFLECRRRDVGEKRNGDTQALFLQALRANEAKAQA